MRLCIAPFGLYTSDQEWLSNFCCLLERVKTHLVDTVVVGINFAVELLATKKAKMRVEGMVVECIGIELGRALPHILYAQRKLW